MTVVDLADTARVTSADAADLTVVGGAGHVGIPLVLSFAAKGLTVNVNDLNLDGLASLKAGRLPFIEYGAEDILLEALRDNRLTFTSAQPELTIANFKNEMAQSHARFLTIAPDTHGSLRRTLRRARKSATPSFLAVNAELHSVGSWMTMVS